MISTSMNIGLTGLQTAQKVVDMLSHNIANADTPGYRRLENHNYEINFSGPDNNPFLPAGVGTTIETATVPWVDLRYLDALKDNGYNEAVNDGLGKYASVVDDNQLSDSFTKFMSAAHDLQYNPTNLSVHEQFDQAGQNFVDNLNRVDNLFQQAQESIVQVKSLSQIELDTIQERLSKLASENPTDGVVTEINYLKQRVSQLTGTISGYNDVLQSIIPPILATYQAIKEEVVAGVNDSYGENIITGGSGQYGWTYVLGGDAVKLTEFGNQKFNHQIGALKTKVGAMMSTAENALAYGQSDLAASSSAYSDAYGVDLADQAVKMAQYQRFYEANAAAVRVADGLIGTLLNIFE